MKYERPVKISSVGNGEAMGSIPKFSTNVRVGITLNEREIDERDTTRI
jgi:hypothetical protein